MHTTTIRRTPGSEAWIIHHGDWSGTAEVCWRSGPDAIERVEIPADVLLGALAAAASDALRSAAIRAIEDWELSIDEQAKRRLGV